MTIAALDPGNNIALKLEFYSPMAGEARIGWKTEAVDATKSKMTWSMDQDLPYLQRYFGLLMGGSMNDLFDKGLANLKGQVEKG